MDLRGDQKSSQICLKVADILIWYNSIVVHLKEQKILHLPKDMFTRFSMHDMLNIIFLILECLSYTNLLIVSIKAKLL